MDVRVQAIRSACQRRMTVPAAGLSFAFRM
jgi:hypothetical protein